MYGHMNVKIKVGDYKWYVPVSCDSRSSAGRAKYETQNKLLNYPTFPENSGLLQGTLLRTQLLKCIAD
jgi:hypothetical protein